MPLAKSKTESFILELPLKTNPSEEKTLLKKLECGRQLYNNCLGEALKRLDLMRESKSWQKARKMPAGKERTALFKDLNKKYYFSDFDIQAYAIKSKNACHIVDHLDSFSCQKIGTRAFRAASHYSYGKFGRPRFKGINQFDSIEGKDNFNGIRWSKGIIAWKNLRLSVMLDPKDKHGVQAHALSCRTKYVRIVRRRIKGKNRFYAQLVQEGKPKVTHEVKHGTVGLDIGPSTIAAVSDSEAFILPFCLEMESNQAEKRTIQRSMDRSLRAINPDGYNPNKTIKKGVKLKKSKSFLRKRDRLKEMHRRKASQRKSLQGKMSNQVLSMGNIINMEKLSYKAWQNLFRKTVAFRAPGMFVAMLRRKAENSGGSVNEFSAMNRLSQTCHCGKVKKKALKERWHDCDCGVSAQRDLYSAFLAFHVRKKDLDIASARAAWQSAEPLLSLAMSRCSQAVSGKARFASLGLSLRRKDLLDKKRAAQVTALDAVPDLKVGESQGTTCNIALGTPGVSHGEVQGVQLRDGPSTDPKGLPLKRPSRRPRTAKRPSPQRPRVITRPPKGKA